MYRHRIVRLFWIFAIFVCVACAFSAFAETNNGKISITTSSEKARQYYLQGRDLTDKLRNRDSLEYFDHAIAEDPQMAIAYISRAQVQPTAKAFFDDIKSAVARADRVSEGEKLWILGVEAGANGYPNKQNEYFKQLVSKYPNDERAYNLLGGNYFALQRYDLAAESLRKAISINPDFSSAYNLLGYANRFLQKYEQAREAFQKYIALIPNDPNPYDSYAELLQKMGKFDESVMQYRKALEKDPNFIASRIGIATDLNYKGDYTGARKELQSLYDRARDDGERRAALFAFTVSYLDEGDLQNAIEEQKKSYDIAHNTNDLASMAFDLNTIGLILLEQGQAQEAQGKFDESKKLILSSSLSQDVKQNAERNHLFNSARVALLNGNLDLAKKRSQEFGKSAVAAKSQFQIWQWHELEGLIALSEKNYDRALAELQQSNLQDPYNLYRIGLAYQGKGDAGNAKQAYARVADFNALNSLTYSLIRIKAKKAAS